ncbi:MAG TPA: hypothetical protein VF897_07645, partial [Roseiflexaceae bacterium]
MGELPQEPLELVAQARQIIGPRMVVCHLLAQLAPQLLDWLFILHLDCVAKRNDCTISAKRIILWLYGTPNGCSVERDKPCIVR